MKVIEELMTEKEEAKTENERDRVIYMTIVGEFQKENPSDSSIFDIFTYEQEVRRIATSESTWERVAGGFVYRSNFAFDEEKQEITFDSYYIAKLGNKYVPDGSKVSVDYFTKHVGDFTALDKAEEIIRKYRIKYQDKVNEQLDKYERRKNLYTNNFINRLDTNDRHTNLYFQYFGSIGKQLLIKWLNRLNRLDIPLETLLIEFKTDVSSAKLYLEGNKEYEKAKAYHMDLDSVLLRVLRRYSPRGDYFYSKYIEDKEMKRTV